ncbi:50S ribosomal protein L29 [Chloroflexota bacterium]
MKLDELRALSDQELAKQLEEAHRELFNLRFRLSTKQLVNHREVPKAKKKIARLKTLSRERELGISTLLGS